MQAVGLSENWKKLQVTLKSAAPAKPSSQVLPSHGVKRKQVPLGQDSQKQSAREAQKPRKRPRMDKVVAQNGVSKPPATIKDLEDSENAPSVRPVRAAADLVNAGLCPT